MGIKGVIFDFNGTLFFDSYYHELAWQQIAKKYFDKNLSKEDIALFHGKNNEVILTLLSNNQLSKKEKEIISKQKEERYREICKENATSIALVAGVIEFFEYLKLNNIPFTIASASIKDNIDFYIKTFQLDRWIEVSTIVYDDGNYPNKIAMFQQAALNLQLNIKDCLIFEDSISGIQYAKEAKAKAIIAIGECKNHKEFPFNIQLDGKYSNFIHMQEHIEALLK